MNSLSEYVKNYLIVTNSSDYLPHLYKLCLEKAKNGRLIVIITSQLYDFSNLLLELDINKDLLKNLIIMYYQTIDEISRKLLLLHSWSLLPSLVAVDLSQLLIAQSAASLSPASIMQKVTLCTVSLLTYLQSVAAQLPKCLDDGTLLRSITGLLILRSDVENFGNTQIQTLKDLYFYKTEMFQDFADVAYKIEENW
ncbi:uncharacterized protein LOC119604275 [Lucilia sericata]|uniref:uncharacterized protein LOC119604275 n=1 Tax=Lucilia sericata TaxID=13632 RepID=UPI0018A80C36|nr:uncharacterized protein LOC119604275 [Lucilia sericata]